MALPGRSILLVEGNALLAMVVEDVLADAGAEVVTAANRDEALRLISRIEPSAAILAGQVQGLSVLPIADVLSDLGVPFMFVSSDGPRLDRGRHMSAVVVAKPFSPTELLRLVERLWPSLFNPPPH